jgi:GNAT superfamily N-acetyltransferase
MAPENSSAPGAFALRHLQTIPSRDATRLFDWGTDLWSIDSYRLAWRPWESSFVGYLGDDPVTHTGVLTHTVSVADRELHVGGVAGVLTLPAARGLGYGTRTLGAATRFLQDSRGVAFVLLFCRDQLIPFYGPRGWRKIEDPVFIRQPDGERPSPLNCLVLTLGEDPWPGGAVRLDSQPW